MQANARFLRQFLTLAFTLFIVALAGCSSEATERKNFMAFLQTRIVDKPGLNVPRPSAEEEKSFGEYSRHFAVIRDFNGALDAKVAAPMRSLMGKGMPRSLPELMGRRADMAAMRNIATSLRTGMDAEVSKADAARAALKQPDDLKAVYDQAYARTVTQPAEAVKEIMPAIEGTLVSAEKLAAYLEEHKEAVKISGSAMAITDPKVLAEANVLMAEMKSRSDDVMAAQRKMNSLMTGR